MLSIQLLGIGEKVPVKGMPIWLQEANFSDSFLCKAGVTE